MSVESRVNELADRVADEFNALRSEVAALDLQAIVTAGGIIDSTDTIQVGDTEASLYSQMTGGSVKAADPGGSYTEIKNTGIDFTTAGGYQFRATSGNTKISNGTVTYNVGISGAVDAGTYSVWWPALGGTLLTTASGTIDRILDGPRDTDGHIRFVDDMDTPNQSIQVAPTAITIANSGVSGNLEALSLNEYRTWYLPDADGTLATTDNLVGLAPLFGPTFTGTVNGITKSMVGLGNVDNTSDVNKPISTATQDALDDKAGAESAGAAIWIGTTAAYLALTPKNATTIYYITD